MNDKETELIKKKIKLRALDAMIQQELLKFKSKSATNPSEAERYFEIYENNIRLLKQFATLI
jgi:hypothetical protein